PSAAASAAHAGSRRAGGLSCRAKVGRPALLEKAVARSSPAVRGEGARRRSRRAGGVPASLTLTLPSLCTMGPSLSRGAGEGLYCSPMIRGELDAAPASRYLPRGRRV